MSMQKFRIKGENSTLIVYDNKVVLEGEKGLLAAAVGVNQGQKTFGYESISTIEFEEATLLSAGRISFNIQGDRGRSSVLGIGKVMIGVQNENTFQYQKRIQNSEVFQAKLYIEMQMLKAKQPQQQFLVIGRQDDIFQSAPHLPAVVASTTSLRNVESINSDDGSFSQSSRTQASTINNLINQFPIERKKLEDDGYKIYLSEKYKVTRNDLFQKFVYDQKMYDDLYRLLEILHDIEIASDEAVSNNDLNISPVSSNPVKDQNIEDYLTGEERRDLFERSSVLVKKITDKGYHVNVKGVFPSLIWEVTLSDGRVKELSSITDLAIFNIYGEG